MDLCTWYGEYISLYKRRVKPKTRESYDRLMVLLSPSLGATPLEDITPDDVQRALIRVEDAAGSRQAQLAWTLLRAALDRAVKSRHITSNPVDVIDKPHHDGAQGRAIRGDDWDTLRPYIDDDIAYALAAHAGLRRGELLAIQRGDVDLAAGVLRIRRQLVRSGGRLLSQSPKSRSGVRDVPILPDLRPALVDACRLKHPGARLVTDAPETINHRWRSLQLAAGIAEPYRLHDLRHTYATRLVAAGCEMSVVQYVLGHSSYQLTADTYTHITGVDAANAVLKIATLVR